MANIISTPAFVLRSHAYGESDRIVTFITENSGKVSGIAKGAMRSKHRFVNTLEPFVKVRLVFRSRPVRDLVFIDRAELLECLHGFRSDLDRFASGSYVLELMDRMVLGREPGTEVFRLVESTLSALNSTVALPAVLRAFELHILEVTGYRTELERCRGCGARAASLESVVMVPARGGVCCPRCCPEGNEGDRLTADNVALLAELQRSGIGTAVPPMDDRQKAVIENALEGLIEHVVTRPLRSRAVLSALRQVGPGC